MEAADQIVRAHGPDVARAIQDITLAAQAERRSEIERLVRRDIGTSEAATVEPRGELPERPLPFGEIAEAFQQFRTSAPNRTG